MSFVDFGQCADDHARILILVLPACGQIKPKKFNKIFERIARLETLNVPGSSRSVRMRYRKYYAIENNAWGDFQVHRRALGLIVIGSCEQQDDIQELFSQYEQMKEKYDSTLLDSRLIIFGDVGLTQHTVNDESVSCNDNNSQKNTGTAHTAASEFELTSTDDLGHNSGGKLAHAVVDDTVTEACSSLLSSSDVLCYASVDESLNIDERIVEFLLSLFWVLESKRLNRSCEHVDNLTLLTAPFEQRKDSSVIDIDGRIYKKKCQGRQKKHLGDLCLLAGVPAESVLHYQTSVELLRSTNDSLWLAGAYEGLASAAIVLLKYDVSALPVQRNSSFSLRHELLAATGSSVSSSALRSVTSSVQVTPSGLDLAVENPSRKLMPSNLPVDIIDNYKEAVINFSKLKDAGVVEMETCLKASRVFIAHERILAAADFLQNVVSINVQLMEEEKVQLFLTLASLYRDMRMFRKAAFYSRIAAMQFVAPGSHQPFWRQCYNLLIRALPGYWLSLDPKEMLCGHGSKGWRSVQLRVLHELVYSARRMGNAAIAIRHLSFLLHAMFDSLTATEQTELADVLRSYTSKCKGTALSIALDNGTILPPVPFTRFPQLCALKLCEMMPHHRPVQFCRDRQLLDSEKMTSVTPFIYSPLHLSPAKNDNKCAEHDVHWVEGDVCEASILFFNPLPFDIEVASFSLVSNGVDVESSPLTFVVHASGTMQIQVQMTPQHSGRLSFSGYSTQVLGIQNHCRFRDVHQTVELCCVADVVPSLPLLEVTTSLPKSSGFSSMADSECVVSNALMTVYAGQSSSFDLKLYNAGKSAIERIDFSCSSSLEQDALHKLMKWNEESLKCRLPLQAGTSVNMSFNVFGLSDFMSSDHPPQFSYEWKDEMESRCRFSHLRRCSNADALTGIVTVELLLLIQYSGASGLAAGYCRQCSLSLTIDILPVLYVTDWSASVGSSVHNCIVTCELINVCSSDVTVTNTLDEAAQQLCIAPGNKGRLSVLVPVLEETDDDSLSDEDISATLLARHVDASLRIHWSLVSSNDVCGVVSLDAVDWTLPQCSLLRCSHIKWTLEVDGRRVSPGTACTAACGSAVSLVCTVNNCTSCVLTDLTVELRSVVVVQSCSSIPLKSNAIDRRAVFDNSALAIGCLMSTFPRVNDGESVCHECSLLFTSAGVFQVVLVCRATVPARYWTCVLTMMLQ